MNKTVTVNISGIIFNIEENAYPALREYLEAIRAKFQREEGGEEIIADIEARVAELFQDMLGDQKNVVTDKEVAAVIEQLGNPQDYDNDDSDTEGSFDGEANQRRKRLYRDEEEQVIGGVASGLAHYFSIDPVVMRVAFVLALFAGFGFLAYIILWIAVPSAKTTSEKLHMKGRFVNVDSIRDERSSASSQSELRRATSRFMDVLTDILNGIGRVLRIIFGVVFIAIAISLIIGTVGAFFGFGLFFDGDYAMTHEQISEYFIPHRSGFDLGLFGAVLFQVGLIIGFFYLGLKMLHRMNGRYPAIKWVVPSFLIIGSILVGYGVSANAAQLSHSEEGRDIIETTFVAGDTLHLDFQQSEGVDILSPRWSDIPVEYTDLIDDMLITGGRVDMVYRPTNDAKLRMEVTRESNGRTDTEAHHRAENISYKVSVDSSMIAIDPFITYPASDGFRQQEVQIDIYIPEGVTIIADPEFRSYQYRWQKHYSVRNENGTLELLDASGDVIEDRRYKHRVHIY